MSDARTPYTMPWDDVSGSTRPETVRLAVLAGPAGALSSAPVIERLRGLGAEVHVVEVRTVEEHALDLRTGMAAPSPLPSLPSLPSLPLLSWLPWLPTVRDVDALRAAVRTGEADMAAVPFGVTATTPHDLECAAVPPRLDPRFAAWVSPTVATPPHAADPWAAGARVFAAGGPIVGVPEEARARSVDDADVVIAPASLARTWTEWPRVVLDPTRFMPRTGQSAIGLEIRRDDVTFAALATALHDRDAYRTVSAEVGVVALLADVGLAQVEAFAALDGAGPGASVRLHVAWRRGVDSGWTRTTVTHPSSEGAGFLARIEIESTIADERRAD